ncbi:MAG: TolC family protein [Desulfovibrionaceae bacterium]|nr:TolC family protein [Desulfovibrionaceae bacterium]
MRKIFETLRTVPVTVAAVSLLLTGGFGCSSNKAGMASPELPAKHWLDEAPGIPIENREKYDAAVPSLYVPGKKFTFEDCVYLTIQQSPALVNSAVDIEIQRVDKTTAAWKYLPEPHMTLTVSQNLTQFNSNANDVSGDYGRTQFEVGFYAPFPNPVATYFETKAQSMLVGIAIATHRKAVGEAIYKIAQSYLTLEAQQYILEAQKSLVPIAREMTEYWQRVEAVEGNQGSAVSFAQQHEREAELGLERAEMRELIQRTSLKILAGVDPHQTFDVDASRAHDLLKDFDGKKLNWDDRWQESEDNLLLRTQIKLADYNIMLAWAQYVPNMSFAVNMNAPRGQSQPESGTPDQFLHFTFDFPLLDWGRRYRGVQTSRMNKAQAFHELSQKRFDYQNEWLQAEQEAQLAMTDLKLAANRYKTAQMQYDEARISFENGLAQLPEVAERQEKMINAQIDYINSELDYRLAQLAWMKVSGLLEKRFLGLPDKELDQFVGGRSGASAGKGPLQPLPEEEPVFSEPLRKEPVDNRPVGHAKPVKLSVPAEASEESGDLTVTPSMPK